MVSVTPKRGFSLSLDSLKRQSLLIITAQKNRDAISYSILSDSKGVLETENLNLHELSRLLGFIVWADNITSECPKYKISNILVNNLTPQTTNEQIPSGVFNATLNKISINIYLDTLPVTFLITSILFIDMVILKHEKKQIFCRRIYRGR